MPAPLDHYKARALAYAAQCGQRMRAGRLNANLSQADLALAIYAPNPASVSHWEAGRFMPGAARQFAIADALTLPMTALWGHDRASDTVFEAIIAERGAPPAQPPTAQEGMSLRAAALASHYVSLQCQHDKHGRSCRRTCPECSAPCRCWCHLSQAATIEPADDPTPELVGAPKDSAA